MIPLHCTHCGAYMSVESKTQIHPKCEACGFNHWQNPTPVAVLLQPAVRGGRFGLVIAARKIEPQLGKWALPGGFMHVNEEIEQAAVREFSEECGVNNLIRAATCQFFHVACNTASKQILLFVRNTRTLTTAEVHSLQETEEAKDWDVFTREDRRLICFPLHAEAIEHWFNSFAF